MSRLFCLLLITLALPSILAHGNPAHRRHRPTPAHFEPPSTPIIHTSVDTLTPASILDDLQCTLCKGLAAGLGPLIRSNASMSVIDFIATEVCEILKIDCKDPASCKDVCIGIIHEHAAEVIQILTDTLLSPPEVCYLIKLCPAPTPPPPPVPGIPVPSNCSDHTGEHTWPAWSLKGKGTFLHLSDIHVDLLYQIGTNSACGEPLCCRAVNGPGNATTAAGSWGNYNCDTPLPVLQDLLNYIANMNPQPDFIIYTGDDPAHDVWEQSRDNNLKAVNAICGAMVTAFPHIPVFPAIGNHEAYPVNQFEGPGKDNWLYDGLLIAWSHWLPEDAMHTLKYGGYYTARIRPGLRVVAINTNMYITENFWLYENHTDFSSQLTWFDNVCSQAATLNEQIIIIGHQHSGSWYQDFSLQFNSVVEKWGNIIVGQFYGHTHSDSMSLWYTNSSNIQTPAGIAYIGGSVTPYTDMNPGYKSYVYSRELNNPYKVLVEDFSQYWTDLTIANINNKSTWNVLAFNALHDLQMSDLSLSSWVTLGNTFRTSNATQQIWNAWLNHKYHGAISINGRDSQASIGCEILSTTHAQRDACEKETTGFVSVKPKSKC